MNVTTLKQVWAENAQLFLDMTKTVVDSVSAVSVLRRWALRDSYETDLCLRTRCSDWGRHRDYSVCFHPAEHHVPVRYHTLHMSVLISGEVLVQCIMFQTGGPKGWVTCVWVCEPSTFIHAWMLTFKQKIELIIQTNV